MKTLSLIACLLALALLLPSQPAQAQVAPGEVTGTVQNTAGATLPNQPITLENVTTGQRFATTSDADGVYRVQAVPPGTYRVMVNTPAGMTAPTQNFAVESGMVNTVNLTVSGLPGAPGAPPAAPSGVIVTAQPVSLTTATSQIQNTFNRLYNIRMPQSNYDSPQGLYFGGYNLTTLAQGVTAGGLGYSTQAGPDAAGINPEYNNWRIGGVDNTNKMLSGAPLVYVSPEATNEVSLFKGQYEPVIPHAIGGKSTLIPSSGSNAVHGEIYDFLQNRILNAKDPLLSAIPQSPRFDQNRLGATIGAPVRHDKVFFTGNFEYIPFGFERLAVPFTSAPTPAGIAALTGNPAIDPTRLAALGLVSGSVGAPTGTQTIAGIAVPVGPVNALVHGWQNSYMGTGNVDFHTSDKDNWHFRFTDNKTTPNGVALGFTSLAPTADRNSFLANISGDHVFGNGAINELRLGYNRWDQSLSPASSLSYLGFPALNFSGGQTEFSGTQGFNYMAAFINTYNLSDVISYQHGSNQIQLGFDGMRTIGRQNSPDLFTNPFSFTSLNTFLTATPTSTILGLGAFGSPGYIGNQWLFSGWIQDRWSMRPSLQISLGVRYDYTTVPQQLSGVNLDAFLGVPGTNFITPHPDTANFSPYFGFAWSPSQKLMNRDFVVRGSFSMSYAGLYGSSFFSTGFPSIQISQLAQFNAYNPTAFSTTFSPTAPLSAATVASITGRMIQPYTLNWNVSPQFSLWTNGVLQLQYLGMRTVHLPQMKLLNTPTAVTALSAIPVFGAPPLGSGGTLAGLTPLPSTVAFPALDTTVPMATFVPYANSWYNAGTARFAQRFSHGFQADLAYTYGHQINDAEGSVLDLTSATRSKHSALFDRRQRFTASGVMDLAPLFTGSSAIVRDVVSNFSLAGTYTFQSAQVLPVVSLGANGLPSPVAFAAGASPTGFVPVGAGAGLNPFQPIFKLNGTSNFNLSATKGFGIGRATLEARGDAYNLFNTGQVTGAPINTLEHGAFDIGGLGPVVNPFSGQFDNLSLLSTNPRMLTVSLRLIF